MLSRIEMELEHVQERRRSDLLNADHARLVAACDRSISLARWAAGPLGRVLFRLSARLLRYAHAEPSNLPVYHSPARAVELN